MALYPTLLLIDDDEDDRDIFAIALKTAEPEAKLITSPNGPDALQKLKDGLVPDFIFVDLNMPYMHGFECLEEIKRMTAVADVPTVIYTTSSSRRDAEETQKAGAAYFLVKPTSLAALSDTLEHIMKGSAAEYFIEAAE